MKKTEREKIKQKFDGRCAYCGIFLEKFHVDHIVPVFKGGTDGLAEDFGMISERLVNVTFFFERRPWRDS
jgi:hypothetical protein